MPVNPTESSSPNQPTRFVEHPARRRAWRHGQRNLAWGVAFLFAALVVIGIAVFVGGPRAMLPPIFCVLSFTALWVLARLKVFAQRNGVFFSLSILALLGAISALLEQAWVHLSTRPGVEPRVSTTVSSQPTFGTPLSTEIPTLIDALRLETPEPGLPRVRATRDLTTTIGDKTYRIRRGDIFLFADQKGNEVTLSAGEFLARVPADAMEMLAPSATASAPAPTDNGKSALEKQADLQVTKRAQEEATRRFPALGRSGTEENKVFLDAYNDLKQRHSDLLDDPEWPLELAQTLAQRLGWKERGGVDDDTPAVVEPKMAPGTRVLAEPTPAESTRSEEPDIPPPPRTPRR